jgi:hypothetical protein
MERDLWDHPNQMLVKYKGIKRRGKSWREIKKESL